MKKYRVKRHVLKLPSFYDYASFKHGGEYSDDDVEGAKALLRMLPVFSMAIVFGCLYSQVCTVDHLLFHNFLYYTASFVPENCCMFFPCIQELFRVFSLYSRIILWYFCFSRATRTWCKASAWTCRWVASYFRPQASTSFTPESFSSSFLSWIEFYFRFSQVATGNRPCFNESARTFLNPVVLTCIPLRL